MPNTCSVPHCRSNYKGEGYTPVFSIPTAPDLANNWLRAICREGTSALKLSIAEQIAEEEKFKIIDFKDLTERRHRMTLPDNCIRWNSDSDTVYLLQLSGNGHNVSVASSIVINSSLGVKSFLNKW